MAKLNHMASEGKLLETTFYNINWKPENIKRLHISAKGLNYI